MSRWFLVLGIAVVVLAAAAMWAILGAVRP